MTPAQRAVMHFVLGSTAAPSQQHAVKCSHGSPASPIVDVAGVFFTLEKLRGLEPKQPQGSEVGEKKQNITHVKTTFIINAAVLRLMLFSLKTVAE